ncbi:translationally-controlled tumor -like isoform 1 [Brachionus plicatilis]|uniref:Translationally-controlled tumor protein homolog n=1 Tax=Brachionus plicatilis TaxID=10195 RepID=A0A3M7SXZ0_BRAPC|nr:translationally-controlled tumor -like isoform 1 [Brachionus plicatilis]
MLVYKDVISGDELFSDSYPIKLVDDLYYEVDGKNVSYSNDIDEALIGGNKAAEAGEEDEGVDSSAVTGINVVINGKLVETGFDKATFKDWLKTYMKKLSEIVAKNNPDRLDKFKSGMQKFAAQVLKNLDEYRFYTGERMDPDGMVILSGYREDQITPYFIFFKDGLEEEKF